MERTKEKTKLILTHSDVCFLLGAGTSVNIEEGIKNFPLMSDLLKSVREDYFVSDFYKEITKKSAGISDQYGIVKSLLDTYLFATGANIESFLSLLDSIEQFIVDETFRGETVECCAKVKECVKKRIQESDIFSVLPIYKKFYQSLHHLKEVSSNNGKAINVFTTNYDMLNELAMEDLGIHYYAGFYGIVNRRFNLAYYDHEYVNTHKIKKANYIIDNDHINLYKLHGSLSWFFNEKNNELIERNPDRESFSPEIIYPSSTKFQKTNSIVYYSSLMREFSDKICQENTTLVVIGTSLSDEHINKLIENALSISTFTLMIFGFNNEEITAFTEKFSKYPNVVVYPVPTTFLQLSDLLSTIEGADQ